MENRKKGLPRSRFVRAYSEKKNAELLVVDTWKPLEWFVLCSKLKQKL